MSPRWTNHDELGRRLRAYADAGLAATPAPQNTVSHRRWQAPVLAVGTVVAAAALAAVVVGTFGGDRFGLGTEPTASGASPTEAAGPSASPTAIPTASPEATPSSSPSTAQPSPSAPAIAGEVPGPDASVPPRPPGISEASIYDVARVADDFGMPCESSAQDPSLGGSYGLDCRRDADGVSSSIVVGYWGVEYIDDVHAVVMASSEGSIDAGAASPMLTALASALLDEQASEWVAAHIDSPECAMPGCTTEAGGSRLTLLVGENGARQLDIAPAE